MSMIHCDECDAIFDSDADPECFVGDGEVFCKWCRPEEDEDCTCSMSPVHSASIDPPTIRRSPSCPVHGRDPDRDRDERMDREAEDWS